MPQTTGGAGGDSDRKKKKKRQPSAPAAVAQPVQSARRDARVDTTPDPVVPDYGDPTPARVLRLHNRTRRQLPTEITYALANTTLSNDDLDKAASFFAKRFDLSPTDFYEPVSRPSFLPNGKVESMERVGFSLGGIPDPVTGQPFLSLRTARRLLEQNEEAIIRQYLERRKPTPGRTDARGRQVQAVSGVTPRAVIDVLNSLTPLVGEDLSFGQALAVARQAAEGRDRRLFKRNLELTMRTSFGMDPRKAIALALQSAREGFEFRDVAEMTAYLGGATREEVAAGIFLQDTKRYGELKVDGKVVKAGVGDLAVLGSIYEALQQREQSFSEAADAALEDIRVSMGDDESLGALWINTTLKGFEIANRPMDAFYRVVADTDAILAPFQETPDGTMIGDALSDAWDILLGRQSVLDNERLKSLGKSDTEIMLGELYLSFLIPVGGGVKAFSTAAGKAGGGFRGAVRALGTREGITSALRLGGELAIDPFTGLGKLGKVTTGRKFLPFLDPEAQGRALTNMLYGKHRVLGNLDIPTFLVRNALKSANPEEALANAVGRFRSEFARDGIHPLLGRSIFNFSRAAAARGVDEETIAKAVRSFIGDAMGVPAKQEGLVAELTEIVERTHIAGRRRAVAMANDPLHRVVADAQDASLRDAARAAGRKSAQQLADQFDRVAQDFAMTGPIMHEVPKIKALRTATSVLPGFDGKAARAWRALRINALPVRQGMRFSITPDLDPAEATEALGTVLTRSRVFSQQEIADYSKRLSSAMRPTNVNRETLVQNILDEAEDRMMSKLADQLGVSADDLTQWTTDVFAPGTLRRSLSKKLGFDPDQVYAIAPGPLGAPAEVRQPLLPSQLRNNFGIIDPVYVRKAAKETMGYARELNAMFRRLGLGSEKLAGTAAKTITPSGAIGKVSREVLRPALGLVKFGWVARPAYVLRIVFGDELLRYMGTEGLVNRLYGTKLAKKALQNQDLESVAEIVIRTDLDPEDAIALKLTRLLEDEPQASQGAIRFVRNSQGDILPPEVRSAMVDRWAAVFNDGSPHFLASWQRALTQYGQDATGRRMVRNFMNGMDAEANIDDILEWHRVDDIGKREAKRMKANVKEFDLDESTRISVEYLDTLMPDRRLGQSIIDGTLEPEDLGAMVDDAIQPSVVHGPALDPRNPANIVKKASRAWGSLLLEKPTNQLIRQPFFKANYSTVYQSLRERALNAGKTVDVPHPPTPELFHINPDRADTSVMRVLSGMAEDEGTHVYHFTPIANYDDILENGLHTGRVRAAEETGVYFGSSHVELESLLPVRNQSDGVLLRLRRDTPDLEATDVFSGAEGEWIVRRPVRADELEVLSPEGDWVALTRTVDGGIPASLDARMRAEAKRFAIQRTQQVMFDFTRTGRLSELLWFVSPFFQPFTEFFLAWPKIVRQNPALVPYAYRLAKAANESGFFKTDENTGEQVIPMSNFAGAAPLLALTTGGKMGNSPGGGWELLAPVSAFNMFATNAYPYKFDGTTIPIPAPSFSPPVQWFLQWSIDKLPVSDDLKQDWMAYLTEFGEIDFTRPQDFMLPSWLRHAMTAAVPSWFEGQTNSNVNRFLALQQAMGLAPDEKAARGQAQAFGFMRAFISAFFPASPRINFPTHELEAEWDEVLQKHEGNQLEALAEFAGTYDPETGEFTGGRHPGMYLIAASKTMWADESSPFPMPASELADRILNSKGGREFASRYPEFAFFIIPREIREGDFDLGAYYRQISEGRRVVRSPNQFVSSAEEQNGWNAFFAVKTQWEAWQQAHPDQASGTPGYDARKAEFDEQIADIGEMFPSWENAYNEFSIARRIDPSIFAHARELARNDEFSTKTDAGQGLREYMERRDELERDMAAANVANLDTKLAERLGFVKRYENIVAETTGAHPDFGLMYEYLGFENDLKTVRTAGDKALDALPDDVQDGVTAWWDTFEQRKDAPYADDIVQEEDRFAAYKDLRDWANTAYDRPGGENPLKLWWDTRNPEEKADYRAGLASRSPIYWSRFDWEVMGIKQNAKQQEFWTQVDEARSRAFDSDAVGANLDIIDAQVAAAAKRSKAIARQLDIINNWSYGLEQAVLHPDRGKALFSTKNTRDDWQDIFEGSHTIHEYMNRYEMTGERDYDPDLRDWYGQIKKAYGKYIERKIKDNPVFAQQWAYMQDLVGTDLLIDTLMPSSNYDLGVVDSETAKAAGTAHLGGRPLRKAENVTLARRPLASLQKAEKKLGVDILAHTEESYRTRDEQAQRYAAYQAGTGNLAAPPGDSDHERGIAVDITSSFLAANPEVEDWLRRNGWARTVPEEPWHWVYRG